MGTSNSLHMALQDRERKTTVTLGVEQLLRTELRAQVSCKRGKKESYIESSASLNLGHKSSVKDPMNL